MTVEERYIVTSKLGKNKCPDLKSVEDTKRIMILKIINYATLSNSIKIWIQINQIGLEELYVPEMGENPCQDPKSFNGSRREPCRHLSIF